MGPGPMSTCLIKRGYIAVIVLVLGVIPSRSHAFFDPTGPAQVMYLAQILIENIKRYQQLQMMIRQAQNQEDFIRILNSGIENSIGLLNALPVKDERILAELQNFKLAYDKILDVYGKIPKSKEMALHLLHDQTVAESLRMANAFKEYSEQQEENSIKIAVQSRQASPKGAARMQAETSAQILRSLSQLIRVNTQMLKLQSEQLAMNNKNGKDQVASFQKINSDLSGGFQNFKLDSKLARF